MWKESIRDIEVKMGENIKMCPKLYVDWTEFVTRHDRV
jgi:hypothetical protein